MEHEFRTLNRWYWDTTNEIDISLTNHYVIRGSTHTAAGGRPAGVMTQKINNSELPLKSLKEGDTISFINFTYTLGRKETDKRARESREYFNGSSFKEEEFLENLKD